MITVENNFGRKLFSGPQLAGDKVHRYIKGAIIFEKLCYRILAKMITKKRNFCSKKGKIFQQLGALPPDPQRPPAAGGSAPRPR